MLGIQKLPKKTDFYALDHSLQLIVMMGLSKTWDCFWCVIAALNLLWEKKDEWFISQWITNTSILQLVLNLGFVSVTSLFDDNKAGGMGENV